MMKIFGCLIIGFFLTLISAPCCAAEFKDSEPVPAYLYKILTVENWDKSQGREDVFLSSDDKAFIHLATNDQLSRIAEKYFAAVPEYVVLKIATKDLKGRLVLESNPGGSTQYYHLYEGSIPLSAVREHQVIKK